LEEIAVPNVVIPDSEVVEQSSVGVDVDARLIAAEVNRDLVRLLVVEGSHHAGSRVRLVASQLFIERFEEVFQRMSKVADLANSIILILL
jgi:hypothetical protein